MEPSTLAEAQPINKSQGKSHNPAEPRRDWAARGCLAVSFQRSRGAIYFFFSQGTLVFQKRRTVRVSFGCKTSGPKYQGALWESQWEWSRRGNDSCYLFEREQRELLRGEHDRKYWQDLAELGKRLLTGHAFREEVFWSWCRRYIIQSWNKQKKHLSADIIC